MYVLLFYLEKYSFTITWNSPAPRVPRWNVAAWRETAMAMAYHFSSNTCSHVMKNLICKRVATPTCISKLCPHCCKLLPPPPLRPRCEHPNGAVNLQDLGNRTIQALEGYLGRVCQDPGLGQVMDFKLIHSIGLADSSACEKGMTEG